jgi:hypothetical protein
MMLSRIFSSGASAPRQPNAEPLSDAQPTRRRDHFANAVRGTLHIPQASENGGVPNGGWFARTVNSGLNALQGTRESQPKLEESWAEITQENGVVEVSLFVVERLDAKEEEDVLLSEGSRNSSRADRRSRSSSDTKEEGKQEEMTVVQDHKKEPIDPNYFKPASLDHQLDEELADWLLCVKKAPLDLQADWVDIEEGVASERQESVPAQAQKNESTDSAQSSTGWSDVDLNEFNRNDDELKSDEFTLIEGEDSHPSSLAVGMSSVLEQARIEKLIELRLAVNSLLEQFGDSLTVQIKMAEYQKSLQEMGPEFYKRVNEVGSQLMAQIESEIKEAGEDAFDHLDDDIYIEQAYSLDMELRALQFILAHDCV